MSCLATEQDVVMGPPENLPVKLGNPTNHEDAVPAVVIPTEMSNGSLPKPEPSTGMMMRLMSRKRTSGSCSRSGPLPQVTRKVGVAVVRGGEPG